MPVCNRDEALESENQGNEDQRKENVCEGLSRLMRLSVAEQFTPHITISLVKKKKGRVLGDSLFRGIGGLMCQLDPVQ